MKKLLLVILVMLMGIAGYAYMKYMEYRDFKNKAVSIEAPVTVNVDAGDSWKQVGRILEKNGIVSSGDLFYYLIRENGWGGELKTGEFEFSGPITPVAVARKIRNGKVKLYTVTIPEGYNKYDAADVFRKKTWITGHDSFLLRCNDRGFLKSIGMSHVNSCEGMLFPSTYSFPRGTDIRDVIRTMDRQMQQHLSDLSDRIESSGMTAYQVLKMASVIEKETGDGSERERIASVLMNRMERGMKLQSDPTVIYGLLPDFDGNLKKRHLLKDHPYNTYTRKGLPREPICFPGRDAVEATLSPEDTDYLYFVSTRKGNHYFSKTLREHNAAVKHYLIEKRKRPFVWK